MPSGAMLRGVGGARLTEQLPAPTTAQHQTSPKRLWKGMRSMEGYEKKSQGKPEAWLLSLQAFICFQSGGATRLNSTVPVSSAGNKHLSRAQPLLGLGVRHHGQLQRLQHRHPAPAGLHTTKELAKAHRLRCKRLQREELILRQPLLSTAAFGHTPCCFLSSPNLKSLHPHLHHIRSHNSPCGDASAVSVRNEHPDSFRKVRQREADLPSLLRPS